MSLSGNLGFVPIDEVLRLLTRSNQQGAVVVSGNGLRGRVFVGKGGIDLATTSDDSDLHRHLVNSGFADEASLRRITTGETTLAAMAEANQEIIELLREMTVESVYQISRRGDDFDVHENVTSPYASPKSFDLEALLADAREREREWEKVSEMVPDLNAPVTLLRDLGDREEVTIRADDWKLLSEIGAGATVSQIADRLGTTRFWTARVAARLVRSELLATPEEPEQPVEDLYDTRVEERDHAYADELFAVQAEEEDMVDDEVTVSRPDESAGSWWQEPETAHDEVEEAEATEDSSAPGPDSSEVEEDTEAFLEKVFSELDSPQSENDEGFGLLRRRRMGSMRDFSSDS